MINVVLIHLGEIFFPYINICISQIELFSKAEIYLVTARRHFSLIQGNVTLVAIEDVVLSDDHRYFLEVNKLNKKFRGGFWRFASERFFYLDEVVCQLNLRNVFHFENDVLIYNDLENIHSVLLKNGIEAASTFDNDSRCIPGYVYFADRTVLRELVGFLCNNRTGRNDMLLLSEFSRNLGSLDYLPVIPDFYKEELKSMSGQVSSQRSKYSERFKIFESIFDAAAMGQYLGGVDARNGIRDEYFINESASYQVNKFLFAWVRDSLGRRCPLAVYDGREIKINNLHIHSKRLRDFVDENKFL